MARPVESQNKGSRFIVLASICVVVTALYFGSAVFIPLALATLFSFLLSPLVHFLERWRLPRAAATLLVILVGAGAAGSIGFLVGSQVASVVRQLPKYQGELHQKIAGLKSHDRLFQKAEREIHNISSAAPAATTKPAASSSMPANPMDMKGVLQATIPSDRSATLGAASTENPIPVRVVTAEPSVIDLIGDYATKFLDPLATAALVLILVIFMLLTREDLRDRVIRLVGRGRLNVTTQALDDASTRISRYLGALAIVNTAYGLCVAGGLWTIGRFLGHGHPFPNVLVWGLLVGLFRFVPYLGIWIGAAPPLLLAFALFPGSAVFFGVVGMFVGLELIVSQFVEPYWYGASTGMSALAVLVAAIFWTWLWGPIGLLLSTPLTVCLVVMGKYIPQLQFLDIILGDEPVFPPHVRIYQRLIASDEEEAAELTRDIFEDKPLEAVYDQVLIPVLAMAEEDHHQEHLPDERLAFIQKSLRDIVEDLGDEARTRKSAEAHESSGAPAEEALPHTPALTRAALPKNCTINVLVLPAQSASDELVALMLSQLLELRGYCATTGSVELLTSEMVNLVEKRQAQIICVSAMPPSAATHARYLCKRIRVRFPDIALAVGVWMTRLDPIKIKKSFPRAESIYLVKSLAEAQDQIDQIDRPLRQAAPVS